MLKLQYVYEASRSAGLRIYPNHLCFFLVHPMHSTRAFVHSALTEMRLPKRKANTQRSKEGKSHLGQTSRCFTDREMEHELSIRNNGICRRIVHFACALRGFGGSLFWAEWRIALSESWWKFYIASSWNACVGETSVSLFSSEERFMRGMLRWRNNHAHFSMGLFVHCACVVNFLYGRLWRKENLI